MSASSDIDTEIGGPLNLQTNLMTWSQIRTDLQRAISGQILKQQSSFLLEIILYTQSSGNKCVSTFWHKPSRQRVSFNCIVFALYSTQYEAQSDLPAVKRVLHTESFCVQRCCFGLRLKRSPLRTTRVFKYAFYCCASNKPANPMDTANMRIWIWLFGSWVGRIRTWVTDDIAN